MAPRDDDVFGPPWDLRSDTVTRPTAAMRAAMADAEVGDDVYGEDPTLARLEEEVARLLGMEAGLFFPSGTMANLCALMTHARPGQGALLDPECHISHYEAGGIARLAGLMPRYFPGTGRVPRPEELEPLLPAQDDIHAAPVTLLCLENTHNRAGGIVLNPAEIGELVRWAKERGLKVHLDGARIFNAAVALGREPAALTRGFDSVMVSLSKGLSAPVGSVLTGSRAFIGEARRVRKLLGGGMRQAGVLGAAGLVALREVERLAEDHRVAQLLAEGLNGLPGVEVRPAGIARTNMVMVDLPGPGEGAGRAEARPAVELVRALREEGVLANVLAPRTVRLVTHRHIPASAVDDIVARFRRAVESVRRSGVPAPS